MRTSYFGGGTGGGGGAVSSVFGRVGAVVAANGDYNSGQVSNSSGVSGATVSNALDTLASAIVALAAATVPTSFTLTTTTPLRIDGGPSANLTANRTLSVLPVSNTTAGVVPQVPGTVGLALISTATASNWGVDFGANNPTTTGGWISNLGAGFFRVGLAPGSGAGSGASQGSIRLPNGNFVGSIYGRNAADTADVFVLGWSSSGLTTQIGSNTAGGNNNLDLSAITTARVRLGTGATVVMSMTTTAVAYAGINSFSFNGVPTVTISQDAAVGAGKALTLQAQNGTSTGGDLVLTAGTAAAANAGGSVQAIPGKGAGLAGNINLGKATTPVWNNMQRGMFIADAESAPTAAPVGGSYVYGFSGGGTARSANDVFTTVWAA